MSPETLQYRRRRRIDHAPLVWVESVTLWGRRLSACRVVGSPHRGRPFVSRDGTHMFYAERWHASPPPAVWAAVEAPDGRPVIQQLQVIRWGTSRDGEHAGLPLVGDHGEQRFLVSWESNAPPVVESV